MTVFKTLLKILNKNKGIVILYSVLLIVFGSLNMKTSDNSTNFVASKPDILIVNEDKGEKLTQNLISYISDNANITDIDDNEAARDDALFYRNVNYIIYIPKDFSKDLLNGDNPEVDIKSTGDYQAYYAQLMLERYIKTAKNYINIANEASGDADVKDIISSIDKTLDKQTEIKVTSQVDTDKLSGITFYFNFMNYGLLAGAIFAICMIITSFNEEKIRRRTIISSMNIHRHNNLLLTGNVLFAIVLWAVYTVVGFVMCGIKKDIMNYALLYVLNSFIFTLCAVTIAFMLANIIHNKNALNGIINVIALGTSFLCGAFVPMQWLPDSVIKIAHILPSYWYIKTNELIADIEKWNIDSLKPLFINMGILIAFSVLFIIIANILSVRKCENV